MSSYIYLCPTSILKKQNKNKREKKKNRAVQRKTGFMAFRFLSTYSQDSAETALMEYYITPHQSPNCSPTPTFQLQSHSTTLLWSPTTWQIVTFLKWLNSVFKLCLNPHTEPPKNNIQMIIQSRNVWHRWTNFLKETKLDSWKGWKLSWRNLLSLCLLTQCASSCLFVRATFFFSTGCVWQWGRDHKRR